MAEIFDNPIISHVERYGMPDEKVLVCEICGEETDELAYDFYGDVVGCRECIKFRDAWEIDV